MPLGDENARAIDNALQSWRQGDVSLDSGLEFLHLADLAQSHSPASEQVARDITDAGEAIPTETVPVLDEVRGLVLLSQTCDIVRGCVERPFVEVAPLVEMTDRIEEIRRLKRPSFAFVPAMAEIGLVADLNRTMTVEKALVAGWNRTPGCVSEEQKRDFAQALARKRARFAFPDDFIAAARNLQRRLADKYNKQTDEGAHLRALREIRVRAAPSWEDDAVNLGWWFIKENDPEGIEPSWQDWLEAWRMLFNWTGRFREDFWIACGLEDLTARDYVESDHFDLDSLSITREP